MRSVLEDINGNKNKNTPSFYYLNNKIIKNIFDFNKLYKEKFKYKIQPNVYDVVGLLCPNYQLIKEVGNYGGYFSYHTKTIAYNEEASNNKDITILHELGHYIQLETNNWYKVIDCYSLSDLAFFERQATIISFYLYNLIFKKHNMKNFNHYFKDLHVSFLYNYYKDCGCNITDDRKEILYYCKNN